jgi:signal transduction histidine kinase
MRQTDAREEFEGFLWGEVALVALMGAALALFLTKQTLRGTWDLPQLRLMLMTLYAVGGGLVALLSASRFSAEGRRFDLLLCGGFLTGSVAWVAFSIAPDLAGLNDHRAATWAGLAGVLLGWTLVALAPFARRRVEERRRALFELFAGIALALALLWVVAHAAGAALPDIHAAQGREPALLTAMLASLALVNLTALIGFGNRFRTHNEDLDRWLALGSTLMLFAALHFVFTPPAGTTFVSQGDFLRLLAYAVLVVGVWRAIRSSDLRRAVAEERARVAREIHDGLAQYLFAITAHISMLEHGAEPEETLPRLKEAALAAQQEARFAVLALSSAAGSAPFDSALRRYVDLLTADGGLEVELEIDSGISLAPDEQIEIFRIVQEGLANARKHAGAQRACVTIANRGTDRLVSVRDDGAGFDLEASGTGAGQGLKNMRQRAATIGGALSLASAPGRGTALEVVLRS